MATPTITIHPAAALFPMMSDQELAELAESIKTFGLREKIQGIARVENDATHWQVIDGRNRLEALRRYLKISDTDIIADYMTTVKLKTLHASPEEYVMMANIDRRNLTAPQRKSLAGKLALMIQEAQKDKPRSERIDATAAAAQKTGVSRRTAATAVQALKPVKQDTKTDEDKPKKEPTGPHAQCRPANIIARLESVVNSLRLENGIALWQSDQAVEARGHATNILALIDLDLERRAWEAQQAASAALALVKSDEDDSENVE